MSTQHDEEECPLCGGAGEVSISKDGTYEGTDYYGCPMCISRERDEEARLIETQRDELLAVNAGLMQAARQALEALEAETHPGWDCNSYHPKIFHAIEALREALDHPKPDLDPAARNGWVLREVLFDSGEPVGHREPQPAAVEQEPVAFLHPKYGHMHLNTEHIAAAGIDYVGAGWLPLYTAPQPARQPLTDAEIYAIFSKLDPLFWDAPTGFERDFARAVERAVLEKFNG